MSIDAIRDLLVFFRTQVGGEPVLVMTQPALSLVRSLIQTGESPTEYFGVAIYIVHPLAIAGLCGKGGANADTGCAVVDKVFADMVGLTRNGLHADDVPDPVQDKDKMWFERAMGGGA